MANELDNKTYSVSVKSGLIDSFTRPIVFLSLFAIVSIIFGYGGQRVTAGTLTVGTLVTFLVYLFQLLTPVSQLGHFFTQYSKVKGATEELNVLLDLESETQEGVSINLSNQDIHLENIEFSYGEKQILKGISIDIPANQKVALLGPSGAGKPTIVNIIERLYPISSGSIRIGNEELDTISLEDWRKQIALVSQDVALLSGSLYDNLIFGLDQEPSKDEVDQALISASFKEDVDQLDEGLQTMVGERGMRLSGGQRQRLQIARAFLRNPKLLLLDEATSNLDSESEERISRALRKISKDKTTLAIAHRLSTITDSDKIYFLENGEVTGEGTHEELYKSHARYAKYVKEQMLDDGERI